MTRPLQVELAAAMVDELCRSGISAVALSPGARSTPLALALADDARLEPVVTIDERSAAFFALGAAKATGRPGVVVTTSGTATGNLLPALIEARYSGTPLIALTADRPPELRDVGANQTIDQTKMFTGTIKWFADPGVPEATSAAFVHWRSLACRAWLESRRAPQGPVHINLPFREPFLSGPHTSPPIAGRDDGAPWLSAAGSPGLSEEAVAALVRLGGSKRGLLIVDRRIDQDAVGAFAEASGWPVLASPLSGCRTGPNAICHYDALLRVEAFVQGHRPETVVQIGGQGTSRYLQASIQHAGVHAVVDDAGLPRDPSRRTSLLINADPAAALRAAARLLTGGDRSYLSSWLRWDGRAGAAIEAELAEAGALTEPGVARAIGGGLDDSTPLFVGSSMPVRDLEWFMPARTGPLIVGNRGASGIDGAVSTASGIAHVMGAAVALIGDLSLLHDRNGLQMAREGINCVFVVINNDGGGIFSFLDQAGLPPSRFERLFGTPHGYSLEKIAAAESLPYRLAGDTEHLISSVRQALEDGGAHLIEVRTKRDANAELHARLWRAVQACFD